MTSLIDQAKILIEEHKHGLKTKKCTYHPKCPFNPCDHYINTGPENCANCETYGCDSKGRWMGYCMNCAVYAYRLERGLPITDGFDHNPGDLKVSYTYWRNSIIKKRVPSKPENDVIIMSIDDRGNYITNTLKTITNTFDICIEKLQKLPLEYLSLYHVIYKNYKEVEDTSQQKVNLWSPELAYGPDSDDEEACVKRGWVYVERPSSILTINNHN